MIHPSFAALYALATEDDRIILGERAAIYEHDAGLSHELAEEWAAAEYIRKAQGQNPQLVFRDAAEA